MSPKKWAALTVSMLLSAIALIIGTVVLIDPFEIYHQATAFTPPIENGTQIYSNAGIAKSYEYDSVVIGSSMTENFLPSQLDSLFGGQFVKLPINAGSPYNHKQMMDMAFATHDVRRVLYGVDVELYTYFYKTPKCEMPDYLYDFNPFNDVRYWFNKSVLARYIPRCLAAWGERDPDLRDTMYTWGDLYPYGEEYALADTPITGEAFEQTPPEDNPKMSQQTMLNVTHNVLPFIKAHPDTEFLFFFPPYSLAMWYGFYRSGVLNDHLNQKEAIIAALLPYDNAKIYDFQARTDWITDLDNYIDASHYGPWINAAMGEAVSRDEQRVVSVASAQANDAIIRALVMQIVHAGAWPDSFIF